MMQVHDHAPPHIDVLGQGGVVELLIELLASRALRGPPTHAQIRKVLQIATERQQELRDAWRRHHG